MKMEDTFSVRNTTQTKAPSLPYKEIKEKVLGKTYDLSLAFIGRTRSQNLNKQLRGKDKPANVLSFELSEESGEVTLCLETIKKEAPKFDHTFKKHVGYLFIHGLFHLKGMDHGSRMESEERRIMKAFNLL